MGLKDMLADQAKELAKGKAKEIIKKIVLKYVLPFVGGIILIAGIFLIVTGAIKDAAEKVAEAATSLFGTSFDNTSDSPTITIDDEVIKSIKEALKKDAIDVDSTYLTDKLLKKSLEAYYATQYPYIEGANYTDKTVKGCIYLKRGTNSGYMSYINYNSFQEKLGTGKNQSDVENIKNYFSMDDEENIVVATWSRLNEVSESAENDYKQQGSTEGGYTITEYKINQKMITGQYAMSYKLPILLANLYSNEGFGIAVAELGIHSKIELTVLDATTKVETVSKETLKMNYKATGTYTWKKVEEIESASETENETEANPQAPVANPQVTPETQKETIITGNFPDFIWVEDYTGQNKPYKTTTQITEENMITVKTSFLDTWVAKGQVTDITQNTNTPSPQSNTTKMDNEPKDYKEDPNRTITEQQKSEIIQKIIASQPEVTQDSITAIKATVYKYMTDHKMSSTITTTETTYTSSDMEILDNTDKFLALIRADANGKFDKSGKLIEYIRKEGAEGPDDIESAFLSSIDMLMDILEEDKEISDYANTMKYIYYKYTNNEKYKTELDFSCYDTSDFTSTSESASKQFIKWLHGWEGGKASQDGKHYIVESDGSASGLAVGHGVDIATHGAELRRAGHPTTKGSKIPVDVVDAIEEREVNEKIKAVKTRTKGLDLTDYQIYALVSRAYNCGISGAFKAREGKTFKQAYQAYWDQKKDDQYGKKDKVNYKHKLYTKYMHLPNTSGGDFLQGLENRRKSEWLLFQTGYFDRNVNDYCSTTSGGDFLEVARTCWETICNSGKYTTYGGTSIPAKGPNIDCSSYVSWVLYQYGYQDFKGWQHTAQTFYQTNWKKKYGWEEISVGSGQNPKDQLQPGDIFVRYGAGTHHVLIVESMKNGKLYAYDCGNSTNWLVRGKGGHSIDRSYFLTTVGNGKIIRVTAPK